MSVVGIDLGNLNTVVAVARNRGIDVIVNETSNRATPSLVSFGEKQRFLGEAAKSLEISNFKNTVGSLKRLIGRPHNDPELQSVEKLHVNAKMVSSTETDEIGAQVLYQNEQKVFSYTELVAMFLVKVREFTSLELKAPVSDCVLSCPTWFTDRERRALLDAASIAGLSCLRLLNDTTASALAYGITKTDLPDPAMEKPRVVCFVDLGHSSYQVSIVSFVKGKLQVLGTAYDRNLGGRDIDQLLVDHYVQEFSAKYKMDIASNPKAIFRLRQACEKVKKILSANAVTMLNVECLMDDKDVSAQIKRSDVETWFKPMLVRLTAPLEAALKAAKLTPADIESVELIGGSTRVPSVKEVLAQFFGGTAENNKLSTTLNQDEAVARGCALMCAIISPVFKVRDFALVDWNSYPVELKWNADQVPPPSKGETLVTQLQAFPIGNAMPSSKMLTFHRALPETDSEVVMNVVAEYQPEAVSLRQYPSGCGALVGEWTISGIKKLAPSDTKAVLKVHARLDANGIVDLDGALQLEEVVTVVEETPAEKEVKPEVKETKSSKKDKKDKKEKESAETVEEVKAEKTVVTTKKHKLTVTSKTGSAPRELVAKWTALEGEMAAADKLVMDTADKRNALEEYVYETRSKLEMPWTEFVTDADRDKIMAKLTGTEDWLYGEGEDATKSVYVEKLNELRVLGDPIAYRYSQAEDRPIAEKSLREYCNSVVVSLSDDEKYSHIPKDKLETVQKETLKKLDWLNEKIGKQNETSKHVAPIVTSEQINAEKTALSFLVTPILNTPKPVVKEEVKEEVKMDTDKPANDAASSAEAEEMQVD